MSTKLTSSLTHVKAQTFLASISTTLLPFSITITNVTRQWLKLKLHYFNFNQMQLSLLLATARTITKKRFCLSQKSTFFVITKCLQALMARYSASSIAILPNDATVSIVKGIPEI